MIEKLPTVHFAVAFLVACVWYWRLPSAGCRGRWERLLWDKMEVPPDTGRYMFEAEEAMAASVLLALGYGILFLFWELWVVISLSRALVRRISSALYRRDLSRVDQKILPTARIEEYQDELGVMHRALDQEIQYNILAVDRWGVFRFLCPNWLISLAKLQIDLQAVISAQEALQDGNPLPAATIFRRTLGEIEQQVVIAALTPVVGRAKGLLARLETRDFRLRLRYLLGQ